MWGVIVFIQLLICSSIDTVSFIHIFMFHVLIIFVIMLGLLVPSRFKNVYSSNNYWTFLPTAYWSLYLGEISLYCSLTLPYINAFYCILVLRILHNVVPPNACPFPLFNQALLSRGSGLTNTLLHMPWNMYSDITSGTCGAHWYRKSGGQLKAWFTLLRVGEHVVHVPDMKTIYPL